MYVSPTCGGCLRGAKETQARVLATVHDTSLRVYVVWAPKNGGRQQDVGNVTQVVYDPRAAQYWDWHRVLTDAYDRLFPLSGLCSGILMVYGRQVRWAGMPHPRAEYQQS